MAAATTSKTPSASTPSGARTAYACVSFDFELAWGVYGEPSWEAYCKRLDNAGRVIAAVLRILSEHRVAATWATVGAIMLDGPDDVVLSPDFASGLGGSDAGSGRALLDAKLAAARRGPIEHWFRPDLVRMIGGCATPQEIGCHSMTHQLFGADVDSGVVRAELAMARAAAKRHRVELESLVFPCNVEGHHEVVREAGFVCYRGGGNGSSRFANGQGGAVGRGLRLVDQAVGMAPRSVRPVRDSHGLWSVPASMFLMPLEGLRGVGGVAARMRKVGAGLEAAARDGGVFHVWMHPHNLMADSERMLELFARVVEKMAERQQRGDLVVASMGEIARRCEAAHRAGESPASGGMAVDGDAGGRP